MKHLGAKKLILGILIMIGAIACFAGVELFTNNREKCEVEQGIHVAGLEYKDGWNLISDAEDYYLMTDNTSTGANAGAKYRLTNDIEVDPRRAKQDVFMGATLDGGGYNIGLKIDPNYDENEPKYKPDTITRDDGVLVSGNYSFTQIGSNGDKWAYGFSTSVQSSDHNAYGNGKQTYSTSHTIDLNFGLDADADPGDVFYFGWIGYADNCKIENVYLIYDCDISIKGTRATGKDYELRLGGICGGLGSNGTITKCLVRFASGSSFSITGDAEGVDSKVAGICAYNAGTITSCVALYDKYDYISSSLNKYDEDTYGDAVRYIAPSGYLKCASTLTSLADIPHSNYGGIDGLRRVQLDGHVAHTSIEFYQQACHWVMMPGIDDGMIIQRDLMTELKADITLEGDSSVDIFSRVVMSGYDYTKIGNNYKKIVPKASGYNLIGSLPTPSKTGWEFLGWWSAALNRYVDSSTTITSNITLIPIFNQETYNITYVGNGGTWSGTGHPNPTTYTISSGTVTLDGNISKDGYTFGGWYDNDSFGGNAITSFSASDTEDKTFYAKWSIITYYIHLHPNGGTINLSTHTAWEWNGNGYYNYKGGYTINSDAVTLPTPNERSGFRFDGWYNSSGYRFYEIGSGYSNNRDLYAKWIATPIVTLDYNHMGMTNPDITVEYGKTYADSTGWISTPVANGYRFLGWKTNYFDVRAFVEAYSTLTYTSDVGGAKPNANGKTLAICGLSGYIPKITSSYPQTLKPTPSPSDGYLAYTGISLPNGSYKMSYYGYTVSEAQGPTTGIAVMKTDGTAANAYISGTTRTYYEYTFEINNDFYGFYMPYWYGSWTYLDTIILERTDADEELIAVNGNTKIIAPYHHTLVAQWEELNMIELVDPYGYIKTDATHTSIMAMKEFDGVDDKIECKLSSLLDTSKKSVYVSVVAYMDDWGKFSTEATHNGGGIDGMRLVSCTESGGWNISSEPGANACLRFGVNDSSATYGYLIATAGIKLADMTPGWHHIEGVFDGTYAYIYIDSQLSGTSVAHGGSFHYTSDAENIDRLVIGAEPTNTGGAESYFKGKIESVFVANTKPSSTQNTITYTPGSGTYTTFVAPGEINTKTKTLDGKTYTYSFEDDTNLYVFLGWKLNTSVYTLGGELCGQNIWFNGVKPSGFSGSEIDNQSISLLTGFEPKNSRGYAQLFAIYSIIDTKNPSRPVIGDNEDPIITGGGGGNTDTPTPPPIQKKSVYTITLDLSGGSLEGYLAYDVALDGALWDIDINGNVITYNKDCAFILPTSTHMVKYGYTFLGWKLNSASKLVDNWKDSPDKDKQLGNINVPYEVKGMYGVITLIAQWQQNEYTIVMHSNIPNNDTTISTVLDQTQVYNLSLKDIFNLPYNIETDTNHNGDDYTFIGWAITSVNSLSYDKLDTRLSKSTVTIVGTDKRNTLDELKYNFVSGGKDILQDKSSVSQLIHGDLSGNQEVHIYAIWSPIYTVTIQSNIPDIGAGTHKHADDADCNCAIYIGRSKQAEDSYNVPQKDKYDSSNIIYSQHYNQGYDLYIQDDDNVFNTPSESGFGLHMYGHYISGWVIKADGNQYVLKNVNKQATDASGWKKQAGGVVATDINGSKISLQYLQGDITLTPQWTPMSFAVVFNTNGSEGYKNGYNTPEYSMVQFNDKYIVKQEQNESYNKTTKSLSRVSFNGNNSSTIYPVDILGYSVTYFEAPVSNNAGQYVDTALELSGDWTYKLEYVKNSGIYDFDAKWFVQVEGYYMPDLYRVELDLDLPYTTDNNFKVNPNGFASAIETSLGVRYPIIQLATSGIVYEDINEYVDYQHKMFEDNGKYYIYLLQDQIIGYDDVTNNSYIRNRYQNGREYSDESNTYLPTFEIDYYQMQYYFTYEPEGVSGLVNRYQTALLDDDHKTYAESKMQKYNNPPTESLNNVSEGVDWEYTYNEDSLNHIESGQAGSVMHVYWYRNVIQLNISNLLEGKQSPNGYTIISESEKVRSSLEEHYVYHLIIVTNYNEIQSEYVVFGFNDLSILGSNNMYKYIQLLQKDGTQYTQDHVALKDLLESELFDINLVEYQTSVDGGKYLIPIYFGNSFTIQAVDQSIDHSVDEFIGYVFNDYTYTASDKELNDIYNNQDTSFNRVDVYDTSNNALQDGTARKLTVDLKNYEEGKNLDNYFLDKDILNINTNFTKVRYVFNFVTTDSNYTHYPEAGNIRVDYAGPRVSGMITPYVSPNFAYKFNVNNEYNVRVYMNIELGYEHLNWMFDGVNGLVDLFNPNDSQLIEFMVNSDFLRANYYTNNIYSADIEQTVGTIYSLCQKMEFSITINILDQSRDGEDVTLPYQLTTSDALIGSSTDKFIIQTTPYSLDILGDGYYYYNEGKFALRKMYIPSVGNYSDITYLVNEFEYPTEVSNYQDLQLLINNTLLNKSIYYDQYVEVLDANRTLQLYVEVAPTIDITFNVVEEAHDKLLGLRQISVGNNIDVDEGVIISKAEQDGQSLAGASLVYTGYWGQQTLIKFKANGRYYEGLMIEDNITRTNLVINPNGESGNTNYEIKYAKTITLTIIPRTYNFSATVIYNGAEYYITGGDGFEDIKNLNGTQIFSTNPEIGELDQGILIDLQNAYFYGDVVTLTYTLNQDLYDNVNKRWAYTIKTEINGVSEELETRSATFEMKFIGSDINVILYVNPYKEGITIQADSTKNVGQIYVQVNTGVPQQISTQGATIKLEVGDKMNVYVKDAIGFEFANKYSYSKEVKGTSHDVVTEKVDLNGGEFNKFSLFATGFQIGEDGTYTLQFKQIPIQISFKYYQSVPNIQEVDAGKDYRVIFTNTDQYDGIEEGSEISILKGTDNEGYSFSGYTYAGAEGEGIALSDKFTITSEIMNYLSGIQMQTAEDGSKYIPLVIYVNYIKQYTFDIEYKGDKNKVIVDLETYEGEKMNPKGYYNYGTAFKLTIKARDTKHYQVKAEVNNDKINTNNQTGITNKMLTNLDNLSGFTISKNMIKDYKIVVEVVAEKYFMGIIQKAYEITTEENEERVELTQEKEWFELGLNIYYRVEGTFEYGTEVKVQIYAKAPTDITKTYYKFTGAKVGGVEVRLGTSVAQEGEIYTYIYKLEGDNLPTYAEMEVNVKALCYVKLELL